MIRRAIVTDIHDIDRLLYQVNQIHADGRPDLFVGGLKKYTDEELAEIIPDDSRPVLRPAGPPAGQLYGTDPDPVY